MPALRLWWVTAQRILLVHRYRQRAPNPPYRDRGTWVRLRLTDISTLLGHLGYSRNSTPSQPLMADCSPVFPDRLAGASKLAPAAVTRPPAARARNTGYLAVRPGSAPCRQH